MTVLPHLAFFLNYLIATLAGMWPAGASSADSHDVARATLEALQPRDVIEAMIAARIIATHHASMDGFSRAMQPDVTHLEATRLRNSAIAAGRSFDAAVRLLDKRRADADKAAQPARSRAKPPAHDFMDDAEDPLANFTPEEIAEAEYALDNDPVELARNELAKRIPLYRCHDMTMEERRIAYAEQSDRTPAQWAVLSARMIAAARQRRAERGITS